MLTSRLCLCPSPRLSAQITLFFSFSIAGGFLPLILRAKGIETSLPIDTTYRNYVIVYLPGIGASALLALLRPSKGPLTPIAPFLLHPSVATIAAGLLMEVKWLGRRWSMAISAGLMGASLFLFRAVDNVAGFVGFNASASPSLLSDRRLEMLTRTLLPS